MAAGGLRGLPGLFPASGPTWALLPSLSAAQVLSSLWRGAAEHPQEGHTAALSGQTDQDSNQAVGVWRAACDQPPLPRQGATLDARVPSSGPAASPSWPHTAPSSRPPLSRAGFCLEGCLLSAAPRLGPSLLSLQTAGSGLPTCRTACRPHRLPL